MRPGNVLRQRLLARRMRLAALLLALLVPGSTIRADEVRLYRIVGNELELYSRVDSELEVKGPTFLLLDSEDVALLRQEGLFDIRPEDMADPARRPRSRADGFLWDEPRSRWIGLSGQKTLSVLETVDGEPTLRELHAFDTEFDSESSLFRTNDPDVYFAAFSSIDASLSRPIVARIEFQEEELLDVQMWRMPAREGDDEDDDQWIANVTSDGLILVISYDDNTIWEFGDDEPLGTMSVPDREPIYTLGASSPDGQTLAIVDLNDGGLIDLWHPPAKTPFLTLPMHDYRDYSGSIALFTVDGDYLWAVDMLAGDLRVWRCEDWIETDAYTIDAVKLPVSSSLYGYAEWIIVGRDAPFEPEPTEWYERGLFQPDQSQPDPPGTRGTRYDLCGGTTVSMLVSLAGLVLRLRQRTKLRRVAQFDRGSNGE